MFTAEASTLETSMSPPSHPTVLLPSRGLVPDPTPLPLQSEVGCREDAQVLFLRNHIRVVAYEGGASPEDNLPKREDVLSLHLDLVANALRPTVPEVQGALAAHDVKVDVQIRPRLGVKSGRGPLFTFSGGSPRYHPHISQPSTQRLSKHFPTISARCPARTSSRLDTFVCVCAPQTPRSRTQRGRSEQRATHPGDTSGHG